MKYGWLAILILLSSSSAWAGYICEDGDKTVSLTVNPVTEKKKETAEVVIKSGDVSRKVDKKNVLKFKRTPDRVELRFVVKTKNGMQELELYADKVNNLPNAFLGTLVTKGKNAKRVSVTCKLN